SDVYSSDLHSAGDRASRGTSEDDFGRRNCASLERSIPIADRRQPNGFAAAPNPARGYRLELSLARRVRGCSVPSAFLVLRQLFPPSGGVHLRRSGSAIN